MAQYQDLCFVTTLVTFGEELDMQPFHKEVRATPIRRVSSATELH